MKQLPYIMIQKCIFTKRVSYSWTYHNEQGGSFGMGQFWTLKAARANAELGHSGVKVYLNTLDWNYETDKAIETIKEIS
jgi:hypothetical protein